MPFIVELITLFLSVPVLALSYYWCFELATSVKYPRDLGSHDVHLLNFPKVSILISTFNEKFVIGRSLEAMEKLDYPKDKIQVVVADDSTDDTVWLIDDSVSELNRLGIDAIVSRRSTRENFKCGALNKAMDLVTGDYILLLDADSIIPPDILSKGIDAMETHSNASFVSFRYGHYNREYN
ncbi:MAG: glycosyltransferase, partial [Nitrososphaerales archaeon]